MSAHHPLRSRLVAAVSRRTSLVRPDLTALRLFDGAADGAIGVTVDRFGSAAVLSVDEDARLTEADVTAWADVVLEVARPAGVEGVYVKVRPRDRSRLGDRVPRESSSHVPRAGVPQPSAIVVAEYGARFEVHPYDGLSTGLFLEHRDNRAALAQRPQGRALNLFAYTCGFAVPLAVAGWDVTNVDVSGRYLEWGRRNIALNGLAEAPVRYLRRDAMSYLAKAATRPDDRYDLVILDPPTFGAADQRRRVPSWRAMDDYPALVRAAVGVVAPAGVIFAATNTRALAEPGVLPLMIREALGRLPRWLELPRWPVDITDHGRVAAMLFDPAG